MQKNFNLQKKMTTLNLEFKRLFLLNLGENYVKSQALVGEWRSFFLFPITFDSLS
jgi:hypothetical protein